MILQREKLLAIATKQGLEGIVSKKTFSLRFQTPVDLGQDRNVARGEPQPLRNFAKELRLDLAQWHASSSFPRKVTAWHAHAVKNCAIFRPHRDR